MKMMYEYVYGIREGSVQPETSVTYLAKKSARTQKIHSCNRSCSKLSSKKRSPSEYNFVPLNVASGAHCCTVSVHYALYRLSKKRSHHVFMITLWNTTFFHGHTQQ